VRRLGDDALYAVIYPTSVVKASGTLTDASSGEAAGRTWVRASVRLNRPAGFLTSELVRGNVARYFRD
jgi:hypothetical protein